MSGSQPSSSSAQLDPWERVGDVWENPELNEESQIVDYDSISPEEAGQAFAEYLIFSNIHMYSTQYRPAFSHFGVRRPAPAASRATWRILLSNRVANIVAIGILLLAWRGANTINWLFLKMPACVRSGFTRPSTPTLSQMFSNNFAVNTKILKRILIVP